MTPHEILSAFRNDGSHEHTLVALFAEVERLRGALKPFAPPDWTMQVVRNGTENDDAELGDVSVIVPGSEQEWRWSFTIADLETARQALGNTHD